MGGIESEALKDLRRTLQAISGVNLEKALEVSLTNGNPRMHTALQAIQQNYRTILHRNLVALSPTELDFVKRDAREAHDLLEKLAAESPKSLTKTLHRASADIERLREMSEGLVQHLPPRPPAKEDSSPLSADPRLDEALIRLRRLEEDSKRLTADHLVELQRQMETQQRKVEETLASLQDAAKAKAVRDYARYFEEAVDDHRQQAERWLRVTVSLAAITAVFVSVVYLYYALSTKAYALTPLHAIQLAGAKLAALSLLVTATIWSATLYRAHQHNIIVNKHRRNALSTFQLFSNSTEDETTRNAVLVQATTSIFSPQTTGYTSDGDAAPAPQVLEIIRGVTGNKTDRQ